MREWPNRFVLKWVNRSWKRGVDKVGAEGTMGVDEPSIAVREVETLVLGLFDELVVILFTLTICRKE